MLDAVESRIGADVFGWWKSAISGKPDPALKVPTGTGVDDGPQPGIYKTRKFKGGPKVPAKVWLTDQAGAVQTRWAEGLILHISVDDQPVNNIAAYSGHMFFEPVSKADVEHYRTNGVWFGEIKIEAAAGDNSRNMSLEEQIEAIVAEADEWMRQQAARPITQEAANQAANWRKRLIQLAKDADAKREDEKRPHLEAGRAVDAKWFPIVRRANDEAKRLNDIETAWAKVERDRLAAEAAERHRQQMEAHRKAMEAEAARRAEEAARIEEERLRAAEEAVARGANPEVMAAVMEALPTPEDIVAELPLPPPPAPPAPVKVQLGGQFGAKSSLRGRTVYVVTDYDKAFQLVKDNAKVREAIDKAAAALCKARGVALDGCEARIEEKVQ